MTDNDVDTARECEALTPELVLLLMNAPEIKALTCMDGVVRAFICNDPDGLVLRIGMVIVPDPSPFPMLVVVKYPRSIHSLQSAESLMASKANKYDFSDIPDNEIRSYSFRVELFSSAPIEAFVAKAPSADGPLLPLAPVVVVQSDQQSSVASSCCNLAWQGTNANGVIANAYSVGPTGPSAPVYSIPTGPPAPMFPIRAGPSAPVYSIPTGPPAPMFPIRAGPSAAIHSCAAMPTFGSFSAGHGITTVLPVMDPAPFSFAAVPPTGPVPSFV